MFSGENILMKDSFNRTGVNTLLNLSILEMKLCYLANIEVSCSVLESLKTELKTGLVVFFFSFLKCPFLLMIIHFHII